MARMPGRKSVWVVTSIAWASVVACGPEAFEPPRAAVDVDQATVEPAASLLARAERHIVEREYRASESSHGLQAPNRRHALRTWFEPAGIRVADRSETAASDLLGLSLVGLGRGDRMAAIPPGEVVHAAARIEILRPGLVEWYVNSPAGLEQGFTLAERPAGSGEIALELAVAHARASLRGDRVVLATSAGRSLEYGKLAVFDAAGASIASRLEVPDPGRVRLVVEDAGASYPLTIDPLLTGAAETQLESNQESASFGLSVSSAGDVDGDGYDDVIVGAPFYDAGQNNEGAAFVFHGSVAGVADGNPVTAVTQLEGNMIGAALGTSVSGAGDVNGDGFDDVIVGAPNFDANAAPGLEGAVFIFHGRAIGIADGNPATAATQLDSTLGPQIWGTSVSGAGDVNGDGYDDVIVGDADRAAFIFHGSATGVADATTATAATRLQSDQVVSSLGSSVSGAGDVNGDGYDDVIVGARNYDAGLVQEGAAFVFLGSASGIADADPTTAATQIESDTFAAHLGETVSGAGDVNGDGYDDVIVGAADYFTGLASGAAFVFLGSASGIADGNPSNAATILTSEPLGFSLKFGSSVAGAGDTDGDGYDDVIVSSRSYGPSGGPYLNGAAYVFSGGAAGIESGSTATAALQIEIAQVSQNPGPAVDGAGDVDGDGYADLLVGAPSFDAGQAGEGAAFVFHGGSAASTLSIVTPVSVWTTSDWGNPPAADRNNLINGSGLSGTGPIRSQTHDNPDNALTMWHVGVADGGLGGPTGAPPEVASQAVVFDLGDRVDVEGGFFWNHNQFPVTGRGVKDFEILVSSDSDPLTARFSSLGQFHLARAGGGPAEPSQFRAFPSLNVRLVRFDIESAHSGLTNDWVGLSEVRFAAPPVAIQWVTIGDPGNACDPQSVGCLGGVDHLYRIAKYEITNTQYCTFLNAVARTDPNGLYDTSMGIDDVVGTIWVGGITRSGSSGNYSYAPIPGKENWPVNFVNFWDAARFANWLHNGQPSGAQDDTTTEDGGYTLTPTGIANNTVTRNPGALYFLPTEDEWYKAAYHDPATPNYFEFPAGSDVETACAVPAVTPNTANCFSAVPGSLLADVGSYTGSPSPYGTFDQGGTLAEWNETTNGSQRGLRGGHKEIHPSLLAASVSSNFARFASPTAQSSAVNLAGLRVASVPEPGASALAAAGVFTLVVLTRRRRTGRH